MKRIILPLFWKFSLSIIAIVLIFGSINALLIWESLSSSMEEELGKREKFIAQSIATQAVEPLLYDDLITLQNLVNETKSIDPAISYIFILEGKQNVLAHSFPQSVPFQLIKANSIESSADFSIQTIELKDSAKVMIRDIAVPIMDKSLGVVRVGIEESQINVAINKTISNFIFMVLVFLIAGIFGAFVFSYIITNPIKIISNTADKIDLTTFQSNKKFRINIRNKMLGMWGHLFRAEDEIDLLARKFNDMIERLENTYEELRATQLSLLQSEKLASIGTLVAGFAHEVNNPIAGLQNCIRRISEDPENLEQTKKYVKLMNDAANRVENIITNLLNFARKEEINLETVDLSSVIENALLLTGYQLEQARIIIENNVNRRYLVRGSQNHLGQVLLNIMLNSIDAINQKVSLNPDSPRRISFTCSANKSHVILNIEDSGIGIETDKIDKIFDPFFTTKETGKGTGLGLSISYNIIQQHNGELKVQSEYNKGTLFTIILPKDETKK